MRLKVYEFRGPVCKSEKYANVFFFIHQLYQIPMKNICNIDISSAKHWLKI